MLSIVNLYLLLYNFLRQIFFTTLTVPLLFTAGYSMKLKFDENNEALSRCLTDKLLWLNFRIKHWFIQRLKLIKLFFLINKFYGFIYFFTIMIFCLRSGKEILYILTVDNMLMSIAFTYSTSIEFFYNFVSHYAMTKFISRIREPTKHFFKFTSSIFSSKKYIIDFKNYLKI